MLRKLVKGVNAFSSHLLRLTLLCVISLSVFTLIHKLMAATPILEVRQQREEPIQRNAG